MRYLIPNNNLNMTSENELIKKLMVSKAIMDKHNGIPRTNDGTRVMNTPSVESYEAPQARYNLPEEFIQESKPIVKNNGPITEDRIMSSKLPDAIKQLMIEHPISQPNSMAGPTLSDDLIDKASRLMNSDASGKQVAKPSQKRNVSESIPDSGNLRIMLKEVVKEVLMENGILSESTQSSNESFTFKVGKHIFEGKVNKIKKIK